MVTFFTPSELTFFIDIPEIDPHIFVLALAATEKLGGTCITQGSLNKLWQLVFGVKNLAAWEMEYIHLNQVASTRDVQKVKIHHV